MRNRWKQGLLAWPSIGFSMLPKLACPACWPAYAGFLTSLGLGFLISTIYLLPLTLAFLGLALGAMVFKARERHGYLPFLFGMVAASGVLTGKFLWESNSTVYASLGLLIMASLWNSWPRGKRNQEAVCTDCGIERLKEY